MAGNKRNTPASLFELLNKSDLNVSRPERKSNKSAAVPSAAPTPAAVPAAAPAPPAAGENISSQKQAVADEPTKTAPPVPSVSTKDSAAAPPPAPAFADESTLKKTKPVDRTIFSMHNSIGPSGAARRSQPWQKPAGGPAASAYSSGCAGAGSFAFISDSDGAPTRMTATPPESLARRSSSFSRS